MPVLGDSNYGEVYADVYDMLFEQRDNVNEVADVLESLAQGSPILKFGVGTGRVAIPLAQRGLKVYGMDNSEAMLAKLRAKPGAENVITVLGDFSKDRADDTFGLVAVLFSTIYLIHTQEGQVNVFRNAARHLHIGGVFLIEAFVHDRSRWNHGHEEVTTSVTESSVTIRTGLLDPLTQIITMQQVVLSPDGITLRPNKLRFIYPTEMDLMARLAGFRLRERWSDWHRSLFNANSAAQIAVYEKVSESAVLDQASEYIFYADI
jgi:SAM-dependent methyltransferase